MWVWRRSWRSAPADPRLLIANLAVRNGTQLARALTSQTVLFQNVCEAGQNARQPPIEAQDMAGNTEERTKSIVDKVPGTGADISTGSGTRTILTTMPEVREASLKVAKSAQRLLSIFTQDLEPLIYGEEPFLEAIKRLVLARSYAKVRVLLADPSRAMVDNNRFLALARRLTSCIDLRAMSPEFPASAGAFIIADDKALVYRLQADRWDGISDMNDPAVVRRYLNFFDEVWQTSMQESQMRQMLM